MPKEIIQPKIFHHEPYWTPNNLEIKLPFDEIPVNIPIENGHNLEKRLQKLMPLSKIIHVDYSPLSLTEENKVSITTRLSISYNNNDNKIRKEIKLL